MYLFGKAWFQNKWASCCTLVPNMHRSLLIVPAPHVFGDASGEIAALEAAAKEQAAAAAVKGEGGEQEGGEEEGAPNARLELLKLLHVSRWSGLCRRGVCSWFCTVHGLSAVQAVAELSTGACLYVHAHTLTHAITYTHTRTHAPPQGRAADLKAELRALLLRQGVRSMRVVPVKRNYAFEDPAVPHGEQWVIKVRRAGVCDPLRVMRVLKVAASVCVCVAKPSQPSQPICVPSSPP
jgi:hypothetical protein